MPQPTVCVRLSATCGFKYYVVLTLGTCGVLTLLLAVFSPKMCMQEEVTLRTMNDGSLPRIFLKAANFNSGLPQSEFSRVSFCRTRLRWRLVFASARAQV